MTSGHFYHSHIRRVVSVFGTIFNNINVVRKDQTGHVVHSVRVPLSYGPKAKFLQRLDEQKDLQGNKVAMKLPRMSFEITNMVYDATTKINRNNVVTSIDAGDTLTKHIVRTFAPYRMNFQLSIMAKNQDDALQIVEQILPYFQPEYTVTIKELDSVNLTTDLPFVLTAVNLEDTYEGNFTERRAIIYTLDFETRIRFYGPVSNKAIIKVSDVNLLVNQNNKVDVNIHTTVGSIEDTPDNYTIVQTITDFGFDDPQP
jgi:hypothetical protein